MPATITIYNNANGPLGKHFKYGPDGRVIKEVRAMFSAGSALRKSVENLAEFAKLRASLGADQALGYGTSAHPMAQISTTKVIAGRASLAANDGVPVLARTKANFSWPDGPGIMMLDHDPAPGMHAMTAEALRKALCDALPALEAVEMLWVPSAGSCIFDECLEIEEIPLRGSRIYILVDDATQIPATGKLLLDRLALNGHASIQVAKDGAMLQRSIIDSTVWQPERLDFVRATCGDGLVQRFQPELLLGPSGAILHTADLQSAALTPLDEQHLADCWRDKRQAADEIAQHARNDWSMTQAKNALGPTAPLERLKHKAEDFKRAAEGGQLDPAQVLFMQDGSEITVADILANPDAFHGQRLCDPMEPDYCSDNRIAAVFVDILGSVRIKSFAHGGREYLLRGRSTAEEDLAGLDDAEHEPQHSTDTPSSQGSMLRVWSPADMRSRPPARWLARGWLPECGVMTLVGDSNVGKTFIALDLALSIARGYPWLGVPVDQGATLYVAAEGGHGIRRRLDAYEVHHKLSLDDVPIGLVDEDIDLRSSPKDAERVIAAAQDHARRTGRPVKLIVLDTLARMMAGGDENSSVDMGSITMAAGKISREVGALVILIHHTGKDASKGARGHSSLRAAVDTQIIVDKRYGTCQMKLDKQRDGTTDCRLAYKLESIDLGVSGDDLESHSSAVVMPAQNSVTTPDIVSGEWEKYALEAYHSACTQGTDQAHREKIVESAEIRLAPMKKWGENGRRQLVRALGNLVDKGVLELPAGSDIYSAGFLLPDLELKAA